MTWARQGPLIRAPVRHSFCGRVIKTDIPESSTFSRCRTTASASTVRVSKGGLMAGSRGPFRWGNVPDKDFTLDITQEFDAGQAKIARVRSNTIAVKVIDAKTFQRTWGPRVYGMAANVTLDRRSYEIGQDIPLHIATATFAEATGAVWGIHLPPNIKRYRFATRRGIYRKSRSIRTTGAVTLIPHPTARATPGCMSRAYFAMKCCPAGGGTYTLWVTWRFRSSGWTRNQLRPRHFREWLQIPWNSPS